MSSFAVTVRKIESVRKHPNADRLDVCRVKDLDYQFVYAKDVLKEGDFVVYFPVDTLINSDNLLDLMELKGKLSGAKQNRIKTVQLRGEISQGVVIPAEKIFPEESLIDGQDVTNRLPVEKYVPPERPCHCGNLVSLPDGISVYDIEGCDNHLDILNILMDEKVCITEKLEGTNFSITFTVENDLIQVNQHRGSIIEIPVDGKENTFWKVAREQKLIDAVKEYAKMFSCKTVTLFGELIGEGIQGNIYKLKGNHARFYDIYENYKWVSAKDKFTKMNQCGLSYSNDLVPILCFDVTLRDWLNGKSIKEACHGDSRLNNVTIREGIVINPMEERKIDGFGRLILKQRDPIYLSRSDT